MALRRPAFSMPLAAPFFFVFVTFYQLVFSASLIQSTTSQNSSNPIAAPVCIRRSDWLGTHYGLHDCQRAVDLLITNEVNVHDEREFEFLAPQAQPIHDLPIMQTPRRYTVRSYIYSRSPL